MSSSPTFSWYDECELEIHMQKYVLLIEDDIFLSKVYTLKLSKQDISLVVLENGKDAIEYIRKDSKELPALVILDLMLPQVSGFEVLEEMKKTLDWSSVPVIILTNLGQESDKKKAQDLGANGYFIKADTALTDVLKEIEKYVRLSGT